MKSLVLISHGLFCEELKRSTEMILGEQTNIYTVPFFENESAEDFRTKLEKIMENLEKCTVLADLFGGTPCNVATKMIIEGSNIDLYAGMNMPMVISFVNNGILEGDFYLVDKGKENIVDVRKQIEKSSVDFED